MAADDVEGIPARAGDGEVAVLDDGRLLPRDRHDRRAQPIHVVERDVGHDRHAAVPDVGGIEPSTESDLDQGDVEIRLREMPEDDRGEQLELGRLPVVAGDRIGDRQDRTHVAREVGRIDRLSVDHDPFAIADEMRLRGLAHPVPGGPQRARRQGQDTALPVGPGHEGPAHGALRIAQRPEECASPPQSEVDAESAAVRQRGKRLVVLERRGRAGDRHSRVSSSS